MSQASVITLSVLLLVGLVAAVTIGVLNYVSDKDNKPNTSTKAVQEMCQPADYKEACFKSLAKVNSDDPKEMVKGAFESTKNEIIEVVSKSRLLKELGEDPKTSEAVKDCKELFQDAADDLQRSFDEIGVFDFNKVNMVLENIKIWLSATMTYQETCLDGFDNTTGDASEKVRKLLLTTMQMSSNGLAIVNEMSTLLGTIDVSSFNRRRLLFDDRQVNGHEYYNEILPFWLRNRRLLSAADNTADGTSDNTLLEDDEPDKRRRRRLLGDNTDGIESSEKITVPNWLSKGQRKLLEATTSLVDDLKAKANVTVAKDGSGKYKTIEQAFNDIPKYSNDSFIIYVKEGVYNEYLVLFKWMTNVVLIGDGPTKTRITDSKNFADGVKTFKTATLSVLGDNFMGKDIGIENSAGAIKHQAVALRVQSDKSIFYNCHMDGYQDTLYTHTYRQFYRDCRVTGTIDFIFGDAAAFFQNCTFVVRKPLENQRCIVTAQGRMERHQPTGIFIHKCRFEADPDYYPVRKKNTAYLARPWKEYSKTIIMESYIDDLIAPEGWLPWEGDFGLETCYYGEYNNVGPGSDMSQRVKWRGIKHIVPARAEKFMPPELYESDDWIRASHVPYDPTLSAMAPGPGFVNEDPNAPEGAPLVLPFADPGSSSSTSSSSLSSGSSSGATPSKGSSSSDTSSSGATPSTGTSSGGSGSSGANPSTGSTPTSSGSSSSGANPSTGSTPTSSSSSSAGATPSKGSSSKSSSSSSSQATPSTGSSSSGSSSLGATTPSTGSSSTSGSSSSGATPTGSSSSGDSSSSGATPTGSSSSSGSSSSGATPSTPSSGSSSSGATPSTGSSSSTGTPSSAGSVSPSSSETSPTSSQIIESPAPTPGVTPEISPIIATLSPTLSISPTATISENATKSTTSSPSTSRSSSSVSRRATEEKPTGPVTIRELERMLMTNEEMGEQEDQGNDDMSGNVPDGDEPSPATVQITPILAPTPSTILGPSLSLSPSDSTSSSPSLSPSDELSDLAPGPGPDVEPADKESPALPPKSNDARSKFKLYELQVILSGIVMWVVLVL